MEAAPSTPVAGFVATMPPTRTRPALTSACACSRERASPRRTSSASSRLFAATSGLVEVGKTLLELPVHVLVDLDVLVQGRLVDIAQPLAGRIGSRHAGGRRGSVRLGHDRRPGDRRGARAPRGPLTMTILPGER